MKKIVEMIAIIGVGVFIIAILAFAYTDKAQSLPKGEFNMPQKNISFVQKVMKDSLDRITKAEDQLDRTLDSMDIKISRNRQLVLAGWKEMAKPKIIVIRDTVKIPVPVPVYIDTSKFDYINFLYQN